MNAVCITIIDNRVSAEASRVCIESSKKVKNDFKVRAWTATIPDEVDGILRKENLQWNYPWEGEVFDFKTGLKKTAYPTVNRRARIACALSHYSIWKACAHGDSPWIVLEHDAKFIAKLDHNIILNPKFLISGINNPLYATRKSMKYHKLIQEGKGPVMPVPVIDSYEVPQGLAGNSAYIIWPAGAKKMIQLVKEHGLWPNDALMCRQLFPKLGVTKEYYTEVQGTPSTTTS